jgi:hypothetical protein
MAKFSSKTHEQKGLAAFSNPPARTSYPLKAKVPTVGMSDTAAGPAPKTLHTSKKRPKSSRPDHW